MSRAQARQTVPGLVARKGGDRLVMVTAYDAPAARMVDAAGVDVILVGDSLAMVVLGHDNTLSVTMDEMLHHVRAVTRARPRALVVADMPYMSYHVSVEQAVHNAGRFVKEGGADAVKIEGGARRSEVIRAVLDAEIPVMGHLGLTPQSYNVMGGFRVQAKEPEAASQLQADGELLERLGAFCIVLEGIPSEVAARVTSDLRIPTIGIGAGPSCDGQVLVFHDIVGVGGAVKPRFVRRYADIESTIVEAIGGFVADVRSGDYPSRAESYHLDPIHAKSLAGRS